MTGSAKPSAVPATSRIALSAAGLAAPIAFLATLAIGLLLIAFGLLKLLPAGTVDAPVSITTAPATAELLRLATGGVVDGTWGAYLVGIMQIALGLGLLVPPARALAGLGCIFATAAVIVGIVWHWGQLSTPSGLNAAGVSLVIFSILLLAGAALGTRAAAKQVGAAA